MKHDILTKLHACLDGVLFARRDPSIREAWDACERYDWLLWYAGSRLTGEDHRRTFVRIALDCARLVLPLFERYRPCDRRVRDCLDVTQRWIDGTATLGDVKASEIAAATAARETCHIAYVAYDASAAAAYAAYAAATAAYAADYDAAAAVAAYAACDDATAAYAGIDSKCCKIIRQYIPVCP